MHLDKKIISLNLALVLGIALLLGVPAAGAVYEERYSADEKADGEGLIAYTSELTPTKVTPETGVEDADTAEAATESPYYITVGGTRFFNTEDSSGSGWSYSAEDRILTLNGYYGSGIRASGDLTICTRGKFNATVTGNSGAGGTAAVSVDGFLFIDTSSGGNARFYGGSGDTGSGGDGIRAQAVFIARSSHKITCTGGYGETSGGSGISGGEVILNAQKMDIIGGDSNGAAGPGISYNSRLYVGICEMTVQAGNRSGTPIAASGDGEFSCSAHVGVTEIDSYLLVFTPDTYNISHTLTLDGCGGTYHGNASEVLSGPYPTYFYMKNYEFTRNGYKQTGWLNGTEVLPLGVTLCSEADTTLYAIWADMQENSVLFIGNGGTVDGNNYRKTTTGASVSIPDRSQTVRAGASGSDLCLFGWCESAAVTTADVDLITNPNDRWYLPGTVCAVDNRTVLYALWIEACDCINTIYYNGNGGIRSTGGEAAVQSSALFGINQSLYVKDEMDSTRDGYDFEGWYDADGIKYWEGKAVKNTTGTLKFTNLYARWSHTYTVESGDGANRGKCVVYPEQKEVMVSLDITSLKNTGTDVIKLPVYCALYENGRMVAIETKDVYQTLGGMTDSVTVDYTDGAQPDMCKIFVFGDTHCTPACVPLECPLE
ncbi:MAG: InlB B-repeat-containing protein [Oscillospiraceae bacterium]